MVAGLPLGYTDAIMLAFAPLDAGRTGDGDAGTDVFGGRPIKVIWLTVTDIGRQALAARSIRGP
jgi:hypothetical protein